MKPGRPRAYQSKEQLGRAVGRYFDSITRTVKVLDDAGEAVLSDGGEPILVTEFVRPPSVSAMCLFLGIDKSTWANYCDNARCPEFKDVTAWAKMRMEAYLEEQLSMREKGVQGIIFNLQNNYGWRQKQEVELGERTRESMQTGEMSLAQKMELIKQAAMDFARQEEAAVAEAQRCFEGAEKADGQDAGGEG